MILSWDRYIKKGIVRKVHPNKGILNKNRK